MLLLGTALLALAADSPAITTVQCGNNGGTAFWISADRIVTAEHVTRGGACSINGREVETSRSDAEKDVAELRGVTNDDWLEVSCEGFTARRRYLAVGYPGSWLPRQNAVIQATRFRFNRQGANGLISFLGGPVYHGMSGGPVLDAAGRATGLINRLREGGQDSYHRPLSETFICDG